MNRPAPELQVVKWFNTETPITLASLAGRVVVIEAFQMLCPGCVSHGLPQAQRIAATFDPKDVVVLGLHTVFEHHAAQGTSEALAAFLHEYRITFPVAMDAPGDNGPIPKTMQAYQLRGTPSLILVDRDGGIARQAFGSVSDLTLGADIMRLMQTGHTPAIAGSGSESATGTCDESACPA